MTAILDPKHQKDLVLRLRRAEGQLRSIQAMIEAGEDCERIAQQLSAARRALDKTFFNVLACAIRAAPPDKAATAGRLEQAAALLARFG